MTNEEIAAYWLHEHVPITTFAPEALTAFGFMQATLDFLSTIGLPAEADPYVNFDKQLRSVSAAFKIGSQFAHFIRIGFDGAGNPFVINTRQNDCLQWLDHEDGFRPHYVNSSLSVFMASLVVYHQFVENLLIANGPDAYFDADFTDEQLAKLQVDLGGIDARTMAGEGFWQDEVTTLLANREEYRAEQ